MAVSVYQINKGINRPIEFKGIKAQFIGWLASGIAGLLLLFAVLYICKIDSVICMAVTLIAGAILFAQIYRLSHKYGQHGMMKAIAKRSVPHLLKSNSRKTYTRLWKGR